MKPPTVQELEQRRAASLKASESLDAAIAQVKKLTPGTSGTTQSLTTNFFPLKCHLTTSFYQYDVVVEPELRNPKARKELVTSCLKLHCKSSKLEPIYKNRSAFAARALHDPTKGKELLLNYVGQTSKKGWRSNNYVVKMTFTRTVDCPKDGISTEYYHVVTSILAEAVDRAGFVKLAGSYYDLDGKYMSQESVIDDNMQLTQGIRMVLHPTDKGLLLNVDLKFRVTRRGTVLDIINAARGGKATDADIASDLENVMGITKFHHDGKKQAFKISKVRFDMNLNSNIPGSTETFKAYMANHYPDVQLKDDKQPLLEVVKERELDRDGKPRVLYFIPEVSGLAGQSARNRQDQQLQQQLKKICLIDCVTRFNRIYSTVVKLCAKDSAFAQYLQSWAISVDPKMVVADQARKLGTVEIIDVDGKVIRQNDRRAWLVSKGTRIRVVPAPKKWVVLHPTFVDPSEFVRCLMQDTINGVGAQWPDPIYFPYQSGRDENRNLQTLQNQVFPHVDENAEFILCILPDASEKFYARVKQETLQEWKVPSQCIQAKNATNQRKLMDVASRTGGQMLVKWGCSLWKVAGNDVPNCLVCGLDFETGPKGENIVALVAVESGGFQYVGAYTQVGKTSQALGGLMDSAIKDYTAQHNGAPTSVIIYRAGMDEGDVPRILSEEAVAAQEVCSKKKISLCFLASLKRAHARILSPPSGSVINTQILPGNGYSFYMVPQFVNIGTATAMKFSVLYNSILTITNGGALEQMTFKMCHMFFGWWSVTREPSVVMYATRCAKLVGLMNPTKGVQVKKSGPQTF